MNARRRSLTWRYATMIAKRRRRIRNCRSCFLCRAWRGLKSWIPNGASRADYAHATIPQDDFRACARISLLLVSGAKVDRKVPFWRKKWNDAFHKVARTWIFFFPLFCFLTDHSVYCWTVFANASFCCTRAAGVVFRDRGSVNDQCVLFCGRNTRITRIKSQIIWTEECVLYLSKCCSFEIFRKLVYIRKVIANYSSGAWNLLGIHAEF